MAMRSCVACRCRREPHAFIRLHMQGVQVAAQCSGTQPGRGAYVCPNRNCLAQITARPTILSRALRAKPDLQELEERVRTAQVAECQRWIRRCMRAGAIVSRRGILGDTTGAGAIVANVLATDASPRSTALIRERYPSSVIADVTLDKRDLGRLIGRGPRAILGVRAGKPGNRLAEHLRRRADLG